MKNPEFIKDIIARLVTNVAMSFPVTSISKISLFNGDKLQLSCDWNVNSREEDTAVYPDQFQPAYYKVYNDIIELSDVEVTGIDTEGKLFKLNAPLEKILHRTAA